MKRLFLAAISQLPNCFSDSFIADGKMKGFKDLLHCYVRSGFYKLVDVFNFFRVQCRFSSTKTENGLSMKYAVKGGEIFFNRKEKSVTRATVITAFYQARELQKI